MSDWSSRDAAGSGGPALASLLKNGQRSLSKNVGEVYGGCYDGEKGFKGISICVTPLKRFREQRFLTI